MKKNSPPKFTVIIPTKDRAEYLLHSLRTCSNQDYKNLDIIVSDDGSVDNTREVVEAQSKIDSRIRYVTPGGNVGMLENFEFALEQVKEGYVIALGGDDGLLPYAISGMNEILIKSKQSMLAWQTPAYFYPGVKMSSGQLIIPKMNKKNSDGYRLIKSEEFLKRQSQHFSYLTDIESPMFYVKGVVSVDLIKRVKNRSEKGRFYSCPTPDGYSGIVLAGEVETWAFSDHPFSMHGVSPTSQGNAYLSKDPKHKEQSNDFFKKATLMPMHRELASQPYSPLISLMTADYLLTCSELPGWPGRYPELDYKKLIKKALSEITDGLYSEDRLSRELYILYKIACYHDFGGYFVDLVKNTPRNSRRVLEGTAFSPDRIYLKGESVGIKNVFDASYAVYCLINIRNNTKLKSIYRGIKNSVKYKLMSYIKKGKFPPQEEWVDAADKNL